MAIRAMRDLLGMSIGAIRQELLVASADQIEAYVAKAGALAPEQTELVEAPAMRSTISGASAATPAGLQVQVRFPPPCHRHLLPRRPGAGKAGHLEGRRSPGFRGAGAAPWPRPRQPRRPQGTGRGLAAHPHHPRRRTGRPRTPRRRAARPTRALRRPRQRHPAQERAMTDRTTSLTLTLGLDRSLA